jgi:hypothetical protein
MVLSVFICVHLWLIPWLTATSGALPALIGITAKAVPALLM